MASKAEYVPGVCNIGQAEIGMRNRVGWLGSAATVVLWAAFVVFRVPAPWRLLLVLPASMGATGFLQAAMHFCAGFGMRGLFNFGSEIGKTDSVEQAEFRLKDRRKARQIGLYSILIGIVIAIAGLLSALPL
jgi:hypothetical protein